MASQRRIEYPVSAGGVVFRNGAKGVEVVLCGRLNPLTWGLPKGTPNPGETLEVAALREVQEETGLLVDGGPRITSIRYWFKNKDVSFHKTVHIFLMRPIGGSTDDHDMEFDVVQWFPMEEAYNTLSFENEVGVVRKAADMLQKVT